LDGRVPDRFEVLAMLPFLIGCVVGSAAALLIAAPFLLPWPLRWRYLVNAQMSDPLLGLGAPPGFEMRGMRMVAVTADRGHVEVVVDEIGPGEVPRRATLTRDGCPAADVAQLDQWESQRTPLLVIADESAQVHVYGPGGAVTDFRLAG
jgi:hypothetical protein